MSKSLSQADAAFADRSFEQAMELYTQAIAQGGADTAAAYLGRAKAHNRLDNRMEAVADAQQAVQLSPQLAAAHAEQGKALHAMEEFESAREAFQMAATLEPTRKIHQNWVDMCRVAMGEELPAPPPTPHLTAAPGGGGATPPPKAPAAKAPTAVCIDDPEYAKYWGGKAPAATAAAADTAGPAKYRHQWLQSSDAVEVAVLAKGLAPDRVRVDIQPQRLIIGTTDTSGEPTYELDAMLHAAVDPAASRFQVLSTKVEVRMKKAQPGVHWPQLEAAAEGAAPPPAAASLDQSDVPPVAYPYAGKKKDWDALNRAVQEEEEKETPEGDAGVMKFFRQLYSGADEETRRAMMKSYQESGGTALSTNWEEVATQDYAKEKEAEEGKGA